MKHDRHWQMKQLFLQRKTITNKELCETFEISIETVRRDLTILEAEGVIRRVYGGATLSDDNVMPDSLQPWDIRKVINPTEKQIIANELLKLIPDNATIALDSGTTILEIAKRLGERKNLTILTNSIYTAVEISNHTDHMVYCIGGAIKKEELITTGFLATDFLNYFSNIDYAIFSADGFDVHEGLTDFSVEMGTLKTHIIAKSQQVIVAVDHRKFFENAFYKVCTIDKIHTVVTDAHAPSAPVDFLRNHGVNVLLASR